MSRNDAHRVADMSMAAEEIADITARGRSAFDTDVALRRAVERCLEIIGEAAKATSQAMRESYPDVPWTAMAKIRDRISHHYHRIDPAQLWVVAARDVPELAAKLRQITDAD